jgi:hypothetical protein
VLRSVSPKAGDGKPSPVLFVCASFAAPRLPSFYIFHPRLTPWAAFLRRSAATRLLVRLRFPKTSAATWRVVRLRFPKNSAATWLLVRLLFPEDLGGESFYGCSFAPGFGGESRFAAGLVQEGVAIPVMLDWDLGEEEAATAMHADQKAMAADLDIFRGDWLWRGKDAEFDFQIAGFVNGYGVEAVVFERGRTSGIGDGAVHRTDGQDVSDAAAQTIVQVKGGESASGFGEVGSGRFEWDFARFERGEDGLVRQLQQLSTLFCREFGSAIVGRLHGRGLGRGGDIAISLWAGGHGFSAPAQDEGAATALHYTAVYLRPESCEIIHGGD